MRKNILIALLAFLFLFAISIYNKDIITTSAFGTEYFSVHYVIDYPSEERKVIWEIPNIAKGEQLELIELVEYSEEASQNEANSKSTLKEGYEFEYWHIDGEEEAYLPSAIDCDLVLVAKIKHKEFEVQFYLNDKVSICCNVEYDENILEIPSFNEYTQYTISDWYTNRDFNVAFDFDNTPIKKDIIIYGKYTISSVNVTLVGFDDDKLYTEPLDYGTKVGDILPFEEEVGYTFVGWCKDKSRTEMFHNEYEITEDCSLFAKYEVCLFNITVNHLDESLSWKEPFGTIIESFDVVEKEGYLFIGCFINENKISTPIVIIEDIVIECKYQLLQFDVVILGINNKELYTAKVNYGEDMLVPSEEAFLQQGYLFDCLEGNYCNIIADTTIYAKYLAIVYVDDAGSILYDAIPPTKAGYTFVGWLSEKEKDVMYYKAKYEPIYSSFEKEEPSTTEQQVLQKSKNSADKRILIYIFIFLVVFLSVLLLYGARKRTHKLNRKTQKPAL